MLLASSGAAADVVDGGGGDRCRGVVWLAASAARVCAPVDSVTAPRGTGNSRSTEGGQRAR